MDQEIVEQLTSLVKEVDELQVKVEAADAARDRARRLGDSRDSLNQLVSKLHGELPRDTKGEPQTQSAKYRKIHKKATEMRQQAANHTRQITKVLEPVNQFRADLVGFDGRLRGTLALLPLTDFARGIRAEIERLLERGLRHRNDLSAVRLRLTELVADLGERKTIPGVRVALPAGTVWEEIEIRFVSDRIIQIKAPGYSGSLSYAEAGFEDRRSHIPNTAWVTLRELAKVKEIHRPHSQTAKVEKAVEALRKSLKTLFSLHDDPFLTYRQEKCYRPKFRLSFPDHEHR